MKFGFRFGKRFGLGRLTPEQRAVLERLERREITEEEAERQLDADVRVLEWRIGAANADAPRGEPEMRPDESEEDAKARELIERIAREVDQETRG